MDVQTQQHLLMTKAAAESLITVAIREVDTHRRGFIEMAAVDGAGNTWIVGWMHQQPSNEFAAILYDHQKYPSALKILGEFPRDDIPAGARGIIGVLVSEWRPSDQSEASLHFGHDLLDHLRALRPLPVVKMATIIIMLEQIKTKSGLPIGDIVAQALTQFSDWAATDLGRAGFPVKIETDAVLVIPGFGCMLRGWILSPTKQIATIRVRLGSSVLACDESMLVGEARPDVIASLPLASGATFPGFVGLFIGNVSPETVQDPLLQIDFVGGSTVTHEIAPQKIKVLGISADLEAISRYYPAIQFENNFAPLARAIRSFERQRASRLFEFKVSRVDKALIVALPLDRSDAAITLEALAELQPALPADIGLVIIASRNNDRAVVTSRFHALAARSAMAPSLFFVDDARHAFFALEKILPTVEATRFAFVSSGLHLQAAGWAALIEALGHDSGALRYFRPDVPARGSLRGQHPLAGCFSWTRDDFLRYAQSMSGYVGGLHDDNGMARYANGSIESTTIPSARFRPEIPSPLAVAVNSI